MPIVIFLVTKIGLIYLMKRWIRSNIEDMEHQGEYIPRMPK